MQGGQGQPFETNASSQDTWVLLVDMLRGGDQVLCMFYVTLVVVVGGDRCQNRENIISTVINVKKIELKYIIHLY